MKRSHYIETIPSPLFSARPDSTIPSFHRPLPYFVSSLPFPASTLPESGARRSGAQRPASRLRARASLVQSPARAARTRNTAPPTPQQHPPPPPHHPRRTAVPPAVASAAPGAPVLTHRFVLLGSQGKNIYGCPTPGPQIRRNLEAFRRGMPPRRPTWYGRVPNPTAGGRTAPRLVRVAV
ncbi:hypothetical protein GQ55_1G306300 [Panicum hallii var. hallii]|uniref:Uncharacterized protein n=1 Tax=Panicum hallii var. hallii TaxID=1504633 RepID=A0A2T7F972_9POAL|nr:hypothetical protein GQ55_1G306300 [Panicum hallii var. hallii]